MTSFALSMYNNIVIQLTILLLNIIVMLLLSLKKHTHEPVW